MGFKDVDESPKFNFTYTPLDYDNYDVDEFGNLDLTNSLTEGSKGKIYLRLFTGKLLFKKLLFIKDSIKE